MTATVGSIRVDGVDLSFPIRGGGRLPVLDGMGLDVADGGIVALIGPNGCGKSTLLRVIAGLLTPDRGAVTLDGAPISGPDPRIGLVFQEPRLLPWRSAADNITYPLELAGWPVERRRERLAALAELVALDPGVHANRPAELSGGTAQRVALARALALEPQVLLLDEPFSALDALTRATLQDELLRIWGERRSTVILVTNDVDEAILLADRIYPMTPGPGAMLGPVIEVGLERPRHRRHMSLTPAYQKARLGIVEFLRACRRGAA